MTFFITSADSASLVLGSLSSRGSHHPHTWLVVVWGVLMGGVAAALLLAGGLTALRNATILVALPFVVVMRLLCVSLVNELRQDPAAAPHPPPPDPRPARRRPGRRRRSPRRTHTTPLTSAYAPPATRVGRTRPTDAQPPSGLHPRVPTVHTALEPSLS